MVLLFASSCLKLSLSTWNRTQLILSLNNNSSKFICSLKLLPSRCCHICFTIIFMCVYIYIYVCICVCIYMYLSWTQAHIYIYPEPKLIMKFKSIIQGTKSPSDNDTVTTSNQHFFILVNVSKCSVVPNGCNVFVIVGDHYQQTVSQLGHSSHKKENPDLKWWAFPGDASGKETTCQFRDSRVAVSIPGSGRSPGIGNGNPLQYSYLKNSIDKGACMKRGAPMLVI